MLYAHHAQLVFNGLGEDEPLTDFSDAWAAEETRRIGNRVPPKTRVVEALYYRELGDYAPQVARYLSTFGGDSVHVVLFDEFKADAAKVTCGVFRFLGITDEVALETPVINPNTVVRFPWIRWVIGRTPRGLKACIPGQLRGLFRLGVGKINTKVSPRPKLNAALRRDIAAYFSPKTPELETILGRTVPWAEVLLEAAQDVDEVGGEQ